MYRNVGVSTDVPSWIRDVRSPTAVIHAIADGAWPPSCRHGRKWSDTTALSRPTSSARTAYSTSSRGPNCSADALYPIRNVMGFSLPARPGNCAIIE